MVPPQPAPSRSMLRSDLSLMKSSLMPHVGPLTLSPCCQGRGRGWSGPSTLLEFCPPCTGCGGSQVQAGVTLVSDDCVGLVCCGRWSDPATLYKGMLPLLPSRASPLAPGPSLCQPSWTPAPGRPLVAAAHHEPGDPPQTPW